MTPNMSAAAKDRETKRGAPQPIRHMRAAALKKHGPDQTAKRSVTRMRDNVPCGRTAEKSLTQKPDWRSGHSLHPRGSHFSVRAYGDLPPGRRTTVPCASATSVSSSSFAEKILH